MSRQHNLWSQCNASLGVTCAAQVKQITFVPLQSLAEQRSASAAWTQKHPNIIEAVQLTAVH